MLYIDPTTKFPQRIQAPYISTEEIENIIDHLKKKYAKDLHDDDIYNQELMNFLDAKNDTK
jgi:DNA segregation ATPase FtsK/SpoIIIE-like protein